MSEKLLNEAKEMQGELSRVRRYLHQNPELGTTLPRTCLLYTSYNPVGKVTIFAFSIPVFGVALSALLLGEQIGSVKTLTALLLVSIGIIVVNREKPVLANQK